MRLKTMHFVMHSFFEGAFMYYKTEYNSPKGKILIAGDEKI